jgi:iron complex transport system substrate-binding protein
MKSFVILSVTALILITLVIGTGCSSSPNSAPASSTPAFVPTASPTPSSFTDDLGRVLIFKGVAQRIVSLSPSNTEIVYALGLQDRLVGVTSYDNFPPEAKNKTIVSDYSTLDMEKIVAVNPDLVLADNIQKETAIPALEKLNVPVYTASPDDMEKIFENIQVIGRLTGKEQEAADMVASLSARMQVVVNKTSELGDSQKQRVLYITWHDPIWTAGDQTTIQELITLAGGSNIASDLTNYATITLEAAVQRNPQVIIVMSSMGSGNESFDFVKNNAQFQSTDALKNGRLFLIDADIFSRTTPRLMDGLETLAKLIHPELFK